MTDDTDRLALTLAALQADQVASADPGPSGRSIREYRTLIICMTVMAIALVGSLTALIMTGRETQQIMILINATLNIANIVVTGYIIPHVRAGQRDAKDAKTSAVHTDYTVSNGDFGRLAKVAERIEAELKARPPGTTGLGR
jgi:hypothetical protein